MLIPIRRPATWLGWLVLTTSLCTLSASAREINAPLLPLTPGLEWTYQVNGNPSFILTETALAPVELNDDGLIGVDTVPIANDSSLIPTTNYWVDSGPSKPSEVTLARIVVEGEKYTFRPPIPIVGSDTGSLNVGLSLEVDNGTIGVRFPDDPNTLLGIDYESVSEVLATNESVTVPAGTYDAVKVQLEVTLNGQLPGEDPLVNEVETRVYWFAEGVGIVKLEITSEGETDLYELTGGTADSDGDGILDDQDNCPETFNPLQENFDGDLLGDACDTDDDQDGVPDVDDDLPLDPTESVDTDGDGIGNNADTDDDGDGMSDDFETQYGLDPLDPSDAESDLDGDGVSNLDEFTAGRNPAFDERLIPIILKSGTAEEEPLP